MPERFQNDATGLQAPNFIEQFQPLPAWLANRLLQPDEKVTWVRGPWFNPLWERYVTHPGLFLLALALGAIRVGMGWLGGQQEGFKGQQESMVRSIFMAGGLILSSIFVLGIASGYFTRLVVTNFRLIILQGYEVCRAWDIDDLPPSLLHYGMMDGSCREKWTIDLDAVKTLLGGSSDQFTNAKTILSFGKQLDRIKIQDKERG